ncbi:hypothetical protein JIG36_34795 [Actinoplanes sp. LDG1-06]|uniref:Uncharacterized protein n=1 Tax=Paractinoplanes ovalisporus TaxID=2810368 RepID=A0ABS2ALE8_9ACTN|nr:hypothetical protein [Actinoplanes ovalisporus]MBM2620682.1 hypothetical protein [Actinoplanes ovalisporus]
MGKFFVHLLDDLEGLSSRAQSFLRRSAWREPGVESRLPIDAPFELSLRREGFAARYAGLRYTVRRSVSVGGQRLDTGRVWDFSLGHWARREAGGWCFGWTGERVSSPVRYLVHTDGRCGVSLGGPFLEVNPSINHMIEGHALMDELAGWHPVVGSALETWVAGSLGAPAADLRLVEEASGPCDRWLCSETVAVRQFQGWTGVRPRPAAVMVWLREP